MVQPSPNPASGNWKTYLFAAAGIAAVISLAMFQDRWLPQIQEKLGIATSKSAELPESTPDGKTSEEPHADHAHAGHSETTSIELSEQARKNINLRVEQITLQRFTKNILVPGMVVERPGRSVFQVTAVLGGIVTKIYPTEGEAITPGQKLFDIRLTHEDLVQSQEEILRTIEELDVIGREIERIEKLTLDGGIAGKALLERKYEQQKQLAGLRSKRQALMLHGLTSEQIDAILKDRKLLQFLTIAAPVEPEGSSTATKEHLYQLQELKIAQGQHVNAGDSLAVLVDHSELFIEGNAFERDLADISRASDQEIPISAVLEIEKQKPQVIPDLKMLYVSPQVDAESRTLHFYVTLPNIIEQNKTLQDGKRYISWKYRPGQRTQLQIPVESWNDQIVLPVDAVVEEGAEAYVFTPNGDHFDRRAVHVQHKDLLSVVIANDGVLFPGDSVVVSAAKQLQLAIKNKSGGGVDPHAGHNH